jgi:CDP-glucose 4,6-dehydratase
VILRSAFRGKRVWLSGHTGFKGGWLAVWLTEMGAKVTGFSLPPQTPFFTQLKLKNRLRHEVGDLRVAGKVRKSILRCRPNFVFHLAAQPLVRDSYLRTLETYEVNTLGTAHVLEALRDLRHPCAAVFVTTDKVYRNEERRHAFREEDPLGGKDPYSASKAAAEILISSYRDSFFQGHPVRIASARSGNVIGGGDYAKDRIVPDAFRALRSGRAIPVRNPVSIRPWQHVLEPTAGYLALALHLSRDRKTARAYNFGPSRKDQKTVSALVRQILKNWPGRWWRIQEKNPPHEAGQLQLNNQQAWRELGWKPRLSFAQSVAMTMDWYRESIQPNFDAFQACRQQINEYSNLNPR